MYNFGGTAFSLFLSLIPIPDKKNSRKKFRAKIQFFFFFFSEGRLGGEKDLVTKLMREYGHKSARPVRDARRPVWVSFRFLPSQIIKFVSYLSSLNSLRSHIGGNRSCRN